MVACAETVVTLDGRIIEPDRPTVRADDPLFARGDGVFETLLVRDGRVCLLDPHLERLTRSAAVIGLPAPQRHRWQAAAATASTRAPELGDAVLRLVYGRECGGGATGFATISPLPARVHAARRDGVSAMTLDRGVTAADGAEVPWSVAGAKSLSYAVNAAALRHAKYRGIDDVVLVSTDGYVLEGPRSSVVLVDRGGALVTPPTTSPILPGTTVAALFHLARTRGVVCASRPLRTGDLFAAQGVWLVSSITLAARVHTLDGRGMAGPAHDADVSRLVEQAVSAAP